MLILPHTPGRAFPRRIQISPAPVNDYFDSPLVSCAVRTIRTATIRLAPTCAVQDDTDPSAACSLVSKLIVGEPIVLAARRDQLILRPGPGAILPRHAEQF